MDRGGERGRGLLFPTDTVVIVVMRRGFARDVELELRSLASGVKVGDGPISILVSVVFT
jgi:hypothetical protein